MNEIYRTKEGELISRDAWVKKVEELKRAVKKEEEITNKDEAEKILTEKINKAIIKRKSKKENAVLFSGGIDSTIIAYLLKRKNAGVKCYTVGTEQSQDVKYAKIIAEEYNLQIKIRIVNNDEIKQAVEEVTNILNTDNKVEIAIGTTEYLAMEMLKKDRIRNVFTGLGSEEIFAGYRRHLQAKESGIDINEACWEGLITTYDRDFMREDKLSRYFKIEERTPFLDEELIKTAMRIDGRLKIKGKIKKYILRKVAQRIGLKEEYAMRPKKAAQYGSRINREVMKILNKPPHLILRKLLNQKRQKE